MEKTSRREVLTVAAVAASLPLLQSALGAMPQPGAADPPQRGGRLAGPPPEKPGWFDTKVVAKDLKDKEFTAVAGHRVLLARNDKAITAITNVCTHKQCLINPTAGKDILQCRCHQAQYHLDGTVAKGPANKALDHYAVRLTAAGTVEVDPGQVLAKDAKEATLTLA